MTMRKYENVDVTAMLGAVMEMNTKNYKSDFKHDIERFREAATKPDGENNHLLWLSRRSGTECCVERDAYLKDIWAHRSWTYWADGETERPCAFAVWIKGMKDGRIMGDIYELDYQKHVQEIRMEACHVAAVSLRFEDGTEMHMPYTEFDKDLERLFAKHGPTTWMRCEPKDDEALSQTLDATRKLREKHSCLASDLGKPSIKAQIAKEKERIGKEAPTRAQTAKSFSLEV
jgi:hypothetical protein